jgi:hypothetical protein
VDFTEMELLNCQTSGVKFRVKYLFTLCSVTSLIF